MSSIPDLGDESVPYEALDFLGGAVNLVNNSAILVECSYNTASCELSWFCIFY